MAAPDLIKCVPMSAALNPSRRSSIALVAVRTCSSTAVEEGYLVSSSAVLAQTLIPRFAFPGCCPYPRILATSLVRVLTGHMSA